jgi:hypothetical protein
MTLDLEAVLLNLGFCLSRGAPSPRTIINNIRLGFTGKMLLQKNNNNM